MTQEEIFNIVEGQNGKECEVTFKDGTKKTAIYFGTSVDVDDKNQKSLVLSEGKAEKAYPYSDVKLIVF